MRKSFGSANESQEEGHMDPAFLGPLVPIAAIIAFAAVKIARVRATLPGSASPEVTARLELAHIANARMTATHAADVARENASAQGGNAGEPNDQHPGASLSIRPGGLLAAPLAAEGQDTRKVLRIGLLSGGVPRSISSYQAFEAKLRDLGYIDGDTMRFEFRNAHYGFLGVRLADYVPHARLLLGMRAGYFSNDLSNEGIGHGTGDKGSSGILIEAGT
jgi:hypothetical protein